jgi:dihydroxyacetone kinase-like predicted kinase
VLVAHVDEGFGYETMYLVQARPGASLDVDAIRSYLESIGDSVLVAGDPTAVKVHVHGERPDEAIGYALSLGTLSRISVENLDHQARDVRETRAAAFAGERHDSSNGSQPPAAPADEALPLAVVAVAAGDGLAAIFRDFGVQRVVPGGQSANPSIGELLEAVRSVPAEEVLVLPNNPNVVLAARQAAELADRPVAVVPTRNAAEGFAALLALDPTKGAAANASQMTEAGRAVQTLSVTAATRDATIGGRTVKAGQWMVLDPDDGLVAVDDDPAAACLAGIAALTPGYELVTLYYGADGDLAATEALARRVRAVAPGAEVEVVHGGQPHYRYLISAE